MDLAYRPLGTGAVHLGLRRSPLRTPEEVLELVRAARDLPNLRIDALMGYEGTSPERATRCRAKA